MHKILIPVDFQKQSLLALQQSYNLAHATGGEIVLLYVHEQSGIFASLFSSDQHSELLSKIDEKLAELAGKTAIKTGLTVTYRIEKGRIYSKILDVAAEINASYIFIGTHSQDESEESEQRVGANASKVIRSANCPVISINKMNPYNGCRNILLPVDFSKETTQKINKCIEIARIYGAGVKIVTAVRKTLQAGIPAIVQKGENVAAILRSEGINCTFEITESDEGENTTVPSILRYASKLGNIDLILILTQQEIGIVEYFVGSHAMEFIRLSQIPVMSVIPKDSRNDSIFT